RVASVGSVWKDVTDCKVRAQAVGGATRSLTARGLPTIAEWGMPGNDSFEWNAVFAPAGTPPAILQQVSAALAEVWKEPAVAKALAGIGAETIGSTPAELDTLDRKSTRLNSSHVKISYAVFCLKKKKKTD